MNWKITQEESLTETLTQSILPFWQHQVIQGEYTSIDGYRLNYAYTIPATAHTTIVLSSGRIESYLKYKEMMFDLWQNGFAVFMIDHRGQGLSERLVEDLQMGYVGHFDDYVNDLLTFVDHIVKPRQVGELHLVCHSMGSAIGALTLLKAPELFKKAVFCAPMFGIKPALPNWLATSLIKTGLAWNALRKRNVGYFFGQTPYIAYPFAINPLCHSESRYRVFRDLYEEYPDIQLGGVTTEWLQAAQHAMQYIADNGQDIRVPLLVFCAQNDKIIDNKRQAKTVSTFSNVEYKTIDGGYHELFNEKDKYRNPVLTDLMTFLSPS